VVVKHSIAGQLGEKGIHQVHMVRCRIGRVVVDKGVGRGWCCKSKSINISTRLSKMKNSDFHSITPCPILGHCCTGTWILIISPFLNEESMSMETKEYFSQLHAMTQVGWC